jgi:hypothetical protein
MRCVILALAGSLITLSSASAEPCNAQAAKKSLDGAALTAFLTECKKEAENACVVEAVAQIDLRVNPLSEPAMSAYLKRCFDNVMGMGIACYTGKIHCMPD